MAIPDYVLAETGTADRAPCVWNFYPSLEAAAAAAPAVNAKEGRNYQPMTFDQYEAAHRASYLAHPLAETTRERFFEMLECMWPLHWTHGELETFCLAEMTSGTITDQYARLGDRFFTRPVDARDRATWITAEEIRRLFPA